MAAHYTSTRRRNKKSAPTPSGRSHRTNDLVIQPLLCQTALLGPSGCGKSTLLYLVGGLLPVEQGSIRVEAKPIVGPGPDRGIVFQRLDRISNAEDRLLTDLNAVARSL
jgi:ABC-type uncharacterized transport system ATPase subunit